MNSDIQLQTDQILKAMMVSHQDAQAIYITLCIAVGLLGVLVGITLFKRR